MFLFISICVFDVVCFWIYIYIYILCFVYFLLHVLQLVVFLGVCIGPSPHLSPPPPSGLKWAQAAQIEFPSLLASVLLLFSPGSWRPVGLCSLRGPPPTSLHHPLPGSNGPLPAFRETGSASLFQGSARKLPGDFQGPVSANPFCFRFASVPLPFCFRYAGKVDRRIC